MNITVKIYLHISYIMNIYLSIGMNSTCPNRYYGFIKKVNTLNRIYPLTLYQLFQEIIFSHVDLNRSQLSFFDPFNTDMSFVKMKNNLR